MMDPFGTLFVSIPSLLDPSLCPPGTQVFHAFAPDWVDAWCEGALSGLGVGLGWVEGWGWVRVLLWGGDGSRCW